MVESLFKQGYRDEDIILDESAPDHKVTLQAEIRRSHNFLDMRYALHSGMGMRQALQQIEVNTQGIWAALLLGTYLDPPSHDKLFEILGAYPDHIVEFSSYSCPVGILGWNTLFWEVRCW